MTFDNDPERPVTRRMDPIDPDQDPGELVPTEAHAAPAPGYVPTGYSQAGPGTEGYEQPAGQPPSGSSGRTVLLAVIALLALLLLVVVGFFLFRSNNDDATPAATDSSVATTTEESTESSAPSSTTTTSEETSATPSGAVTYQLTGDGDVVALRYRTKTGETVVANTGTPWSAKADVGSQTPSLRGIVVRGTVTCSIVQDGETLSSSTSSGGPIRCAG